METYETPLDPPLPSSQFIDRVKEKLRHQFHSVSARNFIQQTSANGCKSTVATDYTSESIMSSVYLHETHQQRCSPEAFRLQPLSMVLNTSLSKRHGDKTFAAATTQNSNTGLRSAHARAHCILYRRVGGVKYCFDVRYLEHK